MHLGKCLEVNDLDALRQDLDRRPIEGINGKASKPEIMEMLSKYGITVNGSKVAITLWGSGMIFREFMHAEDMAMACVKVMESLDAIELYAENPDGKRAGFINIGTGTDLSILELSKIVKEITAYKGEIIWDKSKPDGTLKKLLDVSKLKKLGFEPAFTIESGIRDVYRNYIIK